MQRSGGQQSAMLMPGGMTSGAEMRAISGTAAAAAGMNSGKSAAVAGRSGGMAAASVRNGVASGTGRGRAGRRLLSGTAAAAAMAAEPTALHSVL